MSNPLFLASSEEEEIEKAEDSSSGSSSGTSSSSSSDKEVLPEEEKPLEKPEEEEEIAMKVGKLLPIDGDEEVNEPDVKEEVGEDEEIEGEDDLDINDALDDIMNEELEKKDEDIDSEDSEEFRKMLEDDGGPPEDKYYLQDLEEEDLDVDRINLESKYGNILEAEEIDNEALFIHDMKDEKVELLDAFRKNEEMENQGIQNLSKVRAFERYKKEKKIKKTVRRFQRKLRARNLRKEKKRRQKYQEMSELARTHFRAYEDRLKLNLEIKGATLETSKKSIDVHQRQFKMRWQKEPNQLDLRLCQIRCIGEKLKKGEYVMLISLYDRLGGNPIKYQRHGTKLKRASEPVFHRGHYRDVNLVFDQFIRLTTVSRHDLTYRMILVFELLFMKIGKGENSKVVNEAVGWGVFPLIDCNKNYIQGCFKIPFIKGELDSSIQKYSTIEKVLKNHLEFWLGNFYFEAQYGEVDQDIVPREEYIIEIVHDEEEESETDDSSSYAEESDDGELVRAQQGGADYMPIPGREDDGWGKSPMSPTEEDQEEMLREMEEKIYEDDEGSGDYSEGSENVYSEDLVTPRDARGEYLTSALKGGDSGLLLSPSVANLDRDFQFPSMDLLSEQEKMERRRKEYEKQNILNQPEESPGEGGEEEGEGEEERMFNEVGIREIGIHTGAESRKKKQDVETITAENPRIWFGKPRFGYIREKDDWNEEHDYFQGIEEEGESEKDEEEEEKEFVPKRTKEKIIVEKRGKLIFRRTKEVPVVELERKEEQKKRDEHFISPFSQKAKKKRAKERAKSQKSMEMMNRSRSGVSQLSNVGSRHMSSRSLMTGISGRSASFFNVLNLEEPKQYPYTYEDNFKYRREKFGVTRDRFHGEKTERDVEKISHSFFQKVFPEHGLSKTELVMYKQSVLRKQFSWQKTPIYLEKLKFIWRTTAMDLGLHDIRSFTFYFMLFFLMIVIWLRSYPHVLGQWLWLSLFSIPYNTPFDYFFYIKFNYRTQFQTTAYNFTYSGVGNVTNILLSCFVVLLTMIAQKLFKNLPMLFYRFIVIYVFSVCFEPILTTIPDLFTGVLFQTDDGFYGDFFVLMDYYKNTEGSDLPGILLSLALYLVLILIQMFVFYHYVTYIHMNQRVLDLYKRLYKPERKFYCPHDLEIPSMMLFQIVEQAKEYVGARGRIMKVETTPIPLNIRDSILLRRLKDLLKSKNWPHDYVQKCIEKEHETFFSDRAIDKQPSILFSRDLLEQKRSGAALHKKTSLGRIFIVNKFSFLANALYFDEIKTTTQQQRQNMLLNLFKKYRMIVPNMIDRLKKEKAVQCVLFKMNLLYSDVQVINDDELEIQMTSLSDLRKELKTSIWYRCCSLCWFCYCMWCCFCYCCWCRRMPCFKPFFRCLKRLCSWNWLCRRGRGSRRRDNIILPIDSTSAAIHQIHATRENKIEKWELEDVTTTVLDQENPFNETGKIYATHIVIYCQEKGRIHVRRNFVQTPRGYICEVFNRKQNQLSVSNISLPNSTEYWIDRAFEITRREERKRRKDRRKKKRAKGLLKAPLILMKFKKHFEKKRESRMAGNLLSRLKAKMKAEEEESEKKKKEEEEDMIEETEGEEEEEEDDSQD